MLVIRTDKQAYRPDETVSITLILRNESSVQREYRFSNSQRFDILIEHEGQKVWQWSDHRRFSHLVTTLFIAPDDSRLFKAEWNQTDANGQKVPRGTYTIKAWIVRTEEWAEQDIQLVSYAGAAVLTEQEQAAAAEAQGHLPHQGYYQMLSLHGYPMFAPELGIPKSLVKEFDQDKRES